MVVIVEVIVVIEIALRLQQESLGRLEYLPRSQPCAVGPYMHYLLNLHKDPGEDSLGFLKPLNSQPMRVHSSFR